MSRKILIWVGIVVLGAVILATSSLFVVNQAEQAIVLQFGEPKRVIRDPGLKVKLPFIQNVVYYDKRLLDYAPAAEEVIASDQKRLVVDAYARYRIVDPLRFYQTIGAEALAQTRLGATISGSLRRVIGNVTLSQVLSEERAKIMEEIRADVNRAAANFGLEVVDVRLRRADLPEENSQAIFARMQSEREREAREFRAQGAELAQRIRSRAERERTVIIAEAQKQAQILRGEGEGDSVKIYADAFGKDPRFFSFYRSMQAYREALGAGETTMVLSPTSDFFRFFSNKEGVATGEAPKP
ncbi:MAG: protease modulator HflC [Alphaproteobacteria bacterium]|nr:protease modulator HflC [Alphaproteobacteria bacterium]